MATKILSLELAASGELQRSKRSTGAEVLARLGGLRRAHQEGLLADEALDRIDDGVRARARRIRPSIR